MQVTLTELGFETANVVVKQGKNGEPDKFITVRGISLDDIMKLVRIHGKDIAAFFDDLKVGPESSVAAPSTAELVITALKTIPEVVADLIVLATDAAPSDKASLVARRLPLPVQTKAIMEIARLTFEEHGGVGEFVETVLMMFGGVNGLLANMRGSAIGSLGSDAPLAS